MKWISILLLIGARAVAVADDANDPDNSTRLAMRNLSTISVALELRDGPATLATIYRAASNIVNRGEQPQVFSAEKVLLSDSLPVRILPKYLLTQAYLKANSGLDITLTEALRRYGSAFEICILPITQATNVSDFIWRTQDAAGSPINCRFPMMWVKRPELYGGHRPMVDILGAREMLNDGQFSAYWQAALDWYNRSHPLEAIDQLLARTSDTDGVLNGLTLLKRHPNLESLRERLESLVMSTNRIVVFHVVDELAEFKDERGVETIGKMIDNPDQSRMHIARALGRTGQPKAVKHLERLLAQPHPRLAARDRARIRMEIVLALAKIPSEEARGVLRSLSEDSDTDVSAAARRALAAEPPK